MVFCISIFGIFSGILPVSRSNFYNLHSAACHGSHGGLGAGAAASFKCMKDATARPGASAQNIDILTGTHERTAILKISANIGSHFKICHKNIDKNIKCLKY